MKINCIIQAQLPTIRQALSDSEKEKLPFSSKKPLAEAQGGENIVHNQLGMREGRQDKDMPGKRPMD